MRRTAQSGLRCLFIGTNRKAYVLNSGIETETDDLLTISCDAY